jgi:hypothetical protein
MKKTIIFLFSFFLIIVGLMQSCTKEEPLPWGQVLAYGTNEPIENASVYLQSCSSEDIGQGSFCFIQDSLKTNATGEFSFIRKAGKSYSLFAKAHNYDPFSPTLYLGSGKKNIILVPKAWI